MAVATVPNARPPVIAPVTDASELSAQQGASGTLLTGSMGVDPNQLNLSQNTLLGG